MDPLSIPSGSTDTVPRMRGIVMFHYGRCGSQVLGAMMNHHSRCYWDTELFLAPAKLNPTLQPYHRWPRSPFFPDRPFEFMKRQADLATKEWYGFEIQFYQLHEIRKTLMQFIDEVSPLGFNQYVVLTRRNQLRATVSKLVAAQKAQFHLEAGAQAELRTVRINVNSVFPGSMPLRSLLESHDATLRKAEKTLANKSVLWLNYEDHIQASPRVAYEKMCGFLGIEPENPPVEYARTTPWPLKQVVENFDEIAANLRSTPFEWMLSE